MSDKDVSPQEQWRCACVAWSTAKECLRHRYNGLTESDEVCECACHETDDTATDWESLQ